MEKKRNTALESLHVGEIKLFELNEANEFETTDIISEAGAKYILLDRTNNGAKVTYKFHDEHGKGFKDTFNKIIENEQGSPHVYFASNEETKIKVKRLA